jgi:hypothetical protein
MAVVAEALRTVPTAWITALLESPIGLEKAFEIATADERVIAVALGEADLARSLGVDGSAGLAWARGRLVAASRAAGLGAPMMSVYPERERRGRPAALLPGGPGARLHRPDGDPSASTAGDHRLLLLSRASGSPPSGVRRRRSSEPLSQRPWDLIR